MRGSTPRSARPATAGAALALALSLAWLAAGCSPGEKQPAAPSLAAHEVSQPEGWDSDLKLNVAQDLNPDPHVVEINLEAKIAEVEILPGIKTKVWTYNGSLPGPMIVANVGDKLIVHFKNSLPEETTIHWHGLRVPNNMDGAPGLTQDPVPAGGEFRYEFTLPDAGTYWYHPHVNSSGQVGRGLYGAILIKDPKDPKVFGDDLVLVVSDMSLDDKGQLLPQDNGGKFGDLFGREGNTLLVNGKVVPTLKVRQGKQQRWRIINASRARYFSVRLHNHRFIRLGGDNGLAERSEDVYSLLVTPAERADAVFTPANAPGTVDMMRWSPTDRGYGSVFNRAPEDMLKIVTVNELPVTPEPIPEHLRDIERIDVAGAAERTMELTINLDNNDVVMGINGVPYGHDKPFEATVGETQVWHVINHTDFAHPFHLHGFFFQVLDDSRVLEWKDTINVPVDSQVDLAVRFDDRPGMWMLHCHILDHADVGMMGHLHVAPRDGEVLSDTGAQTHQHSAQP
jgi:FtsP/CotA-like multicopper oxidase with cupredoxin domain